MRGAAILAFLLMGWAGSPGWAADCSLSPMAETGRWAVSPCRFCHRFVAGTASREGAVAPNLHDIYGERAATQPGFAYSAALRAAGAVGLTWTDETLGGFLADPPEFLAGFGDNGEPSPMGMAMADPATRDALIAFLKAIKGRSDCP